MSDLFKKLNTLVKSTINDALGNVIPNNARPGSINPMSKRLDKDVAALRERINAAIAHEDELQAKIRSMEDEIAQLDQQADAAVKQGNDALARHLVEKIQRLNQRLTMAQSDLREHQIVAQELIQRVNLLDATISEARHSDAQAEPKAPDNIPVTIEENSEQETENPAVRKFSKLVQDTQAKLTEVGDKIASQQQKAASLEADNEPVSRDTVDDDLAIRRGRLSKR